MKIMKMLIIGLLAVFAIFPTYSSSKSSNFKEHLIVAGLVGFGVGGVILNNFHFNARQDANDKKHVYKKLKILKERCSLSNDANNEVKVIAEGAIRDTIAQHYNDLDLIGLQNGSWEERKRALNNLMGPAKKEKEKFEGRAKIFRDIYNVNLAGLCGIGLLILWNGIQSIRTTPKFIGRDLSKSVK